MQFSLPVLPFGPGIAKAGAGVVATSRAVDSNAQPSNVDFQDFLPVDPSPAPKSNVADKNLPGAGLAKPVVQLADDSDPDAANEIGNEESDEGVTTNGSSENWFVANAVGQRFIATPPAEDAASLTSGVSQGEAEEGSDTIPADNAGGKAVGLTQPMPPNAQGDGRTRAIANRAERKPFVAPEVPVAPEAGIAPVATTPNEEPVAPSTPAAVVNMAPEVAVDLNDEPVDAPATIDPLSEQTNEEPAEASTALTTESVEPAVSGNSSDPSLLVAAEVPTTGIEAPASTVVETPVPGFAENISDPVDVSAPRAELPIDSTTVVPPEDEPVAAIVSAQTSQTSEAATAPTAENPVVDAVNSHGRGVPAGKAFPVTDPEKLSAAPGLAKAAEKFAAGFERRRGISTTPGNEAEIKSLKADKANVATAPFGFGINTAKTQLSMAAPATTSDLPSSLTPSMTTEAVSATSALSHQVKEESSGEAFVSAARRAVDSAIAMAEHFAGGEHRGVSLQFTVSGVELAVRVQLRGDAVHTTFRTDSPELRAALAHEWQVVNAQPADRALRLADPVFASSSNGSSAQPDAGFHQQRENGARGGQFENNPFASFRSPSRPSTAAAPRPTTLVQEADLSSGRLRTFA